MQCIKTEAVSAEEVSIMLPLLVAGSSLRILLPLAHYRLVASFVRSKPPGRKMVGGHHSAAIRILDSYNMNVLSVLRLLQTSTYLQHCSVTWVIL